MCIRDSYEGVWCNYILHTNEAGILHAIHIDEQFRREHIRSMGLTKSPGDKVEVFMGANQSLGTLFLQFDTREQLNEALVNQDKWLKICLE